MPKEPGESKLPDPFELAAEVMEDIRKDKGERIKKIDKDIVEGREALVKIDQIKEKLSRGEILTDEEQKTLDRWTK